MENNKKIISIVIACRNEEKNIEKCLDSLIQQNYPKENLEIIIADGASTDNTKEIIKKIQISNPLVRIKLLDNHKKISSFGFNLGIKQAKGEIIVIFGAHSFADKNFIAKSVEYLEKIKADCVGGPIETINESSSGKIISLILSSLFGVGGSRFRTSKKGGYVDTVAYGAYKKEVFDKIGLFNERLVRNYDIEFNTRLIKSGGKIFMTPEIKSYYRCPDSFIKLARQSFSNGLWNIYTQKIAPSSLRLRHFIPLCFILSLLGGFILLFFTVLGKFFLSAIIGCYILTDVIFSFKITLKNDLKYFPFLFIGFFILHLSYGFGSLWGILNYYKIKK